MRVPATAFLTAAVAALATSAAAQTVSGWSGQATIYGWLPAVNGAQEGPDGQPLVDLNKNDVLSRLDVAFMGLAEIRKDRFGLFLDAIYADLSSDASWIQGRVETNSSVRLGMYTVAAAWRAYEADRTLVDLYGGARFFDTKLTFGIATDNRGREIEAKLDWADPIVGVRAATPLSERWTVEGFADVGGFDSSTDLSWQVYGGLNYAFTDRWSAAIGYRYLSILYQATDRAKLDIDLQGPLVGVTYRF